MKSDLVLVVAAVVSHPQFTPQYSGSSSGGSIQNRSYYRTSCDDRYICHSWIIKGVCDSDDRTVNWYGQNFPMYNYADNTINKITGMVVILFSFRDKLSCICLSHDHLGWSNPSQYVNQFKSNHVAYSISKGGDCSQKAFNALLLGYNINIEEESCQGGHLSWGQGDNKSLMEKRKGRIPDWEHL